MEILVAELGVQAHKSTVSRQVDEQRRRRLERGLPVAVEGPAPVGGREAHIPVDQGIGAVAEGLGKRVVRKAFALYADLPRPLQQCIAPGIHLLRRGVVTCYSFHSGSLPVCIRFMRVFSLL